MSAVRIALLLFLVVPLVEIYVLIEIGSALGAAPTILLVVLTAVIGAALMRAQGIATLLRARASMAAGEVPAIELLEGAIILVAGALLLTPGFVTDAAGFVCLVPALRRQLIVRAVAACTAPMHRSGADPGRNARIIDGEFRRSEDLDR